MLSSLQLSINHCCCIRASFWAPPPLKSPWVFSTRLALTTPSGLQVGFQHIPGCCVVLADSLLSLSPNSHCLSGAEAQPCCGGRGEETTASGVQQARGPTPRAYLQAVWTLISSGLPRCLTQREGAALARLPAHLLLSLSE